MKHVPMPSDRPVLHCKKCDLTLTPKEIALATDVTKFALANGVCPLCTLNSLVRDQPELIVINNTKEVPDETKR